MSAVLETPILAVGRRIADASRRNRSCDIGGEERERVGRDQATRLMSAAYRERIALIEVVCGLPAETIADAVLQLEAAYELVEPMAGAFEGVDAPAYEADLVRILQAIASVLRVVSSLPGAVVPEASDGTPEKTWALRWKGELPPVRIAQEFPQ